MLPFPKFYDPNKVDALYREDAARATECAREFQLVHGVKPAGRDTFRIAAFGIDVQIGFCLPGSSLFVPGAVEDTRRAVEWIYEHADRITGLCFSMDTHRVFQIFHPAWWTDVEGKHPAPFTAITTEDVRRGRWRPIAHPAESLEYTKRLEASGKYVLTVWPYHTLLGGVSHALVPAVMEAAIFHSVLRNHQTHFETKGTHSMTENYSVLSPEVLDLGGRPVGEFNAPFFKMLMEYDRVYVFGQAKSHCVLSTLQDLRSRIRATDPSLVDKVYVLEDAMSPVPGFDFPKLAERAFEEFRRDGMHIVKTSDPIDVP
jgi:nicotinamidase-related amidase